MKKIFFLFLILPCFVFSQNERQKLYSLEECINIALSNNSNLAIFNERSKSAEAKYKEARTLSLPNLKFMGNYSRLSDIDPFNITLPPPISQTIELFPILLNNTNLRLNLMQPIFTGSKLSGSIDVADFSNQAAIEDYKKQRLDLITDIKICYFNIIKTVQLNRNVRENIYRIESHINDAKNMLELKQITTNDFLKIEVQYYKLKSVLVETENMVSLNKLKLCNLMGVELNYNFDIAPLSFDEIEIEPLNEYLKSAISNRNDLKSIESRVKIAEKGISIANSNWYPQVYLNANYHYANPNSRLMPPTDKFKESWDVGVSVSFDIWNWGATSDKVEQAKAQQKEAELIFNSLKDLITLDVNRIYLNIMQMKESLVFQRRAVEQAEEDFRISKEKFEKGYLSSSDLLDSETSLYEATAAYINTQMDYNIAIATLENVSAIIKSK
jgi:outer membrane protein TolC